MTEKPVFEGLAVCCIDGRFWMIDERHIDALIERQLSGGLMDVIMTAGASARLLVKGEHADLYEDIQLSYRDHGVRRLFIFEHEQCGKYADLASQGDTRFDSTAETTLGVHDRNSREAANFLAARLPNLEIHRFYEQLDGTILNFDS